MSWAVLPVQAPTASLPARCPLHPFFSQLPPPRSENMPGVFPPQGLCTGGAFAHMPRGSLPHFCVVVARMSSSRQGLPSPPHLCTLCLPFLIQFFSEHYLLIQCKLSFICVPYAPAPSECQLQEGRGCLSQSDSLHLAWRLARHRRGS